MYRSQTTRTNSNRKELNMKAKKGLYYYINRRKKLGISRSKKKSTVSASSYSAMKNKTGGFSKFKIERK